MTAWLRGLSAFPLTPLRDGGVDQAALEGIAAGVPLFGIGSTRARVGRLSRACKAAAANLVRVQSPLV